ncbi:hypothetical protein FQN49_005582 [Arthroderma sp. PD_2]|nr:hypothetical protein FQN49_005582 [Arthroderma sp. PD_2]
MRFSTPLPSSLCLGGPGRFASCSACKQQYLFTTYGAAAEALCPRTSPFTQDFHGTYIHPPRVNAGVYSETVERNDSDNAEEGFRLLLPFSFPGHHWESFDVGARISDGSFVGKNTSGNEVGPFAGDSSRAQRLEYVCSIVGASS